MTNAASLRQVLQQRLGLIQVERVEALSEPAVDGREQVAGLGAPPVDLAAIALELTSPFAGVTLLSSRTKP